MASRAAPWGVGDKRKSSRAEIEEQRATSPCQKCHSTVDFRRCASSRDAQGKEDEAGDEKQAGRTRGRGREGAGGAETESERMWTEFK